MTYNDIMSQLATAKKVNSNGDGGWEYVRTTRATEQTLQGSACFPRWRSLTKKKGEDPKNGSGP
jgi:hypothetical protein